MSRRWCKKYFIVHLLLIYFLLSLWPISVFAISTSDQPKIDLFCPDISIKEALLTAAFQADVEIVFFEDLSGKVNIRKDGVTFEKALDLILKNTDVSWYLIDGVYYIGTPPVGSSAYIKISSPEKYPLNYINSKELYKLLPQYAGNLILDAPYSVILSGPENLREEIKKEIEKLDHPKEHIQVKTIVAEIKNDTLKDIGVNLSAGDDENLLIGSTASIGGSFERLEKIDAVLRALQESGEAVIHSESEILVLEGEEGRVWSGKDVYYSVETEGTAGTTSNLEIIELGAGIKVIPQYIGEGKIKVDLEAQLKNLEDDNETLPVVISRDTNSSVTLKEKEPLFIAGVNTTKTSEIRNKLLEKNQDSATVKLDEESQLVIFLEAERKSPQESPLVVKLKSGDIKVSPSTIRKTTTEYQFGLGAWYGTLIIPEYQTTPQFWYGLEVKVLSGENFGLYGQLLKASDKNLWLGKVNLEYAIHTDEDTPETINLGIGLKGFWGDVQESAFVAYVKDIRQVEENLLTFFSIGLQFSENESLYFASLGVSYIENEWVLEAEAKYQWNNRASNWTLGIEGKYRLADKTYLVAGYRDNISGSPIEPFDDFDFRGLYAGVTFMF
ncbi:hypothetical protein [Atribacter laminatus]|uniref:Type II/III secretion system secretin-like domain-containing protein n=1 Tax=Atribacter laminatus TaxID=2847778 RepID=A0A7T1AP23_ATRLM|nr:hypothetical protein [Atribacter laminatus]QPM69459.1 hypothetical protein RT761_02692 [Atribacter laminatus]